MREVTNDVELGSSSGKQLAVVFVLADSNKSERTLIQTFEFHLESISVFVWFTQPILLAN